MIKFLNRMFLACVVVASWGAIPSWASSVPAVISGKINLNDPSISQPLNFTVEQAPTVTFSQIQPLQCDITAAGAAVTTATLTNGGTNPVWSMTPLTDFTINPSTGVITVGSNGLTADICPAGGTVSVTVTASW